MQKAIFKSGSLFPVPVMEKPSDSSSTIRHLAEFDPEALEVMEAAWEVYEKTILPVPIEHHSSFEEGREYEGGVDYETRTQGRSTANTWVNIPDSVYEELNEEDRRLVAIPLPISKREEVQDEPRQFLNYVKEERSLFSKAMHKLWLAHTPDERVAIENLLIAYDQLTERFEQSLTPLSQNTPSTGAIK